MKLRYPVSSFLLAFVLVACGGASDNRSADPGTRLLAQSGSVAAINYQDAVQQLYISYFGRPADAGGLSNFMAALAAARAPTDLQGLDSAYSTNPAVKALVNSFQISAESIALYGNTNTTAFVSSIYQNVLGRTPASGDAGVAFWAGEIDSGKLSKGKAALSIMAGALANNTTQGKLDAATVNNKVTVAKRFTSLTSTASVDGYSGNAAAAQARTLLNGVTATTNLSTYDAGTITLVSALAASAPVPVSGLVSNGFPVIGATVCPFAIASNGARGAATGDCATTGADGKFTLKINRNASSLPGLFEASGGTYRDAATGNIVSLAAPLRSAFYNVRASTLTITSLTEIAYLFISQAGVDVNAESIKGSSGAVAWAFNLQDAHYSYPTAFADAAKIIAADVSIEALMAKRYALALGTIATYQDQKGAVSTLQSIATCLRDQHLVTNCGSGPTGVGGRLTSAMASFKASHSGFDDVTLRVAEIGPRDGVNAGNYPRLTVTACSTPIDYTSGPCAEQDKAVRILVQCNRASDAASVDAYFLRFYTAQLTLDSCLADNSTGDFKVLYTRAVISDNRSVADQQAVMRIPSVCPVGYTKTVVANFCSRNGTGGLCSPGSCPPVTGTATPPRSPSLDLSAAAACANAPYLNGSGDPQSDNFYKLAQFDACLHRATGLTTYDPEGRNACTLGDAIPRAAGSNFRSQYCPYPF